MRSRPDRDEATGGRLSLGFLCEAPLLLAAAISFFGLFLGALANGFLNLPALLACRVGMYVMMRIMKDKK